MFSIDSRAFVASMKQARSHLSGLVLKALERTSVTAASYAKINTLYRSRTGTLRSSIQHRLTSPTHAQTSANAKHAKWIEEGTKPHVIEARRKRALRFVQNGTVRFATRVYHPGTKPRPFMQRARDRVEPLFDRLCKESIDRMFG